MAQNRISATGMRRLSLIPEIGASVYNVDVESKINPQGGLFVGYQLSPLFQFQVGLRYVPLESAANERWGRVYQNDALVYQARLQMSLRGIILSDKPSRLQPFVALGIGGIQSNVSNTRPTGVPGEVRNYTGTDVVYTGAIGVSYYVSPLIDVRLSVEHQYSNAEYIDGHNYPGRANAATDQYTLVQAGVSIKLGSKNKRSLEWNDMRAPGEPEPKADPSATGPHKHPFYFSDKDQDGVADSLDLDNATPAGVRVTTRGVPMDTDYDGIPDYLDPCPVVPGTNGKGCPEPAMPIADSVAAPAKREALGYLIIVGSMVNRENAMRLLDRSIQEGFKDARILPRDYVLPGGQTKTFYRVAVQRHPTRDAALKSLRDLRSKLKRDDLWLFSEE